MNEDNLNMEIRKFLKKVGITSQRIIENEVNNASSQGKIKIGDKISIEMNLRIKSLDSSETIEGIIKID